MDIAAFLFNRNRCAEIPADFKEKVQSRLLVPQAGQEPYEHIFLMKWVWPCGPQGGRLGNDVIVGAHDGVVRVVGPDYQLPSNDCKDVKGLWAKACEEGCVQAHYVCLVRIKSDRSLQGQKLAILIGTHAPTAHAPDGQPCRDVKDGLAALLAASEKKAPRFRPFAG